MGLWISHGAWSSSYGTFFGWRIAIAHAAGIELMEMEGYSERPKARWSDLAPDRIHILLDHDDSEGEIDPVSCGQLADRLEELLPLIASDGERDWQRLTQEFIAGARAASAAGEPLVFS